MGQILRILVLFLLSYTLVLAAKPTTLLQPRLVQRQHPVISITLSSNATTGYQWYLLPYPRALMKLTEHTIAKPQSKLIGAPGSETWTFKLSALAFETPMQLQVQFVHRRATQGKNWPVTTMTLLTQA